MQNTPKKQRLSKVMAAAGVASRRACEELIFQGKVKVDGQVVLLPQTMVTGEEEISVGNELISAKDPKVYYMLNKPAGYLCSTISNSKHTKLVLDLFEETPYRLFTVGRLDKETEGLLIVTNDGHFANKVMHPSSNIDKEYLVKTDHEVTAEHLKALSAGTLVEGVYVTPLKVVKVRKGTLKITIGEGKKREIRLLMDSAGLPVKQLVRIRIGSLLLGELPLGNWREMTEKDKKLLFS